MGFGAAAWKVAARGRGLGRVPNNTRFLILPSVRVPNLASKRLGPPARRVAGDFEARYGIAPVLLEGFGARVRFAGTCYRAASWRCLGETVGRGKLDRERRPVKAVDAYPLEAGPRHALGTHPMAGIPTACGGWGETLGAYRLFNNAKVNAQAVLEPHYRCTEQRMREHPVVLCVQDTTELDDTGRNDIEGLGAAELRDPPGPVTCTRPWR